ncbi:MAG: ASPIC/UnbV domain-containing protein, partial [Acidobacteriaceae bacterium]|nr:ASPIC/UnbV domain-containing protein [Acidobacteriaceae bacterium]
KLIGTESNRSAIGARVLVQYGGKQQVQEVISQSSFCSCNDRRLHFGLGNTTAADVEIRWPKGTIQSFAKVAANQLVIFREGQANYERAPWPGR